MSRRFATLSLSPPIAAGPLSVMCGVKRLHVRANIFFLGVDVLCLQIFCFVLRLGLLDMKLLLQQFLFVLIRFIAAMLAVLLILAFIGAGMSVGVLIVYNLWF